MATVTTCNDIGAQENKVCVTVSIVSHSIWHQMMGPDAMILAFWMVSFKPAFSLSSFTFIKRLFSFSLLSAIRVVSSAHLRSLLGQGCHKFGGSQEKRNSSPNTSTYTTRWNLVGRVSCTCFSSLRIVKNNKDFQKSIPGFLIKILAQKFAPFWRALKHIQGVMSGY